jgi:hypothetical protein
MQARCQLKMPLTDRSDVFQHPDNGFRPHRGPSLSAPHVKVKESREGNRGRMSKPDPPLTLGSFSRPILGRGLYAPSRRGGLTSCSPRCFGGQAGRRRLGARQNLSHSRSARLVAAKVR